MVEHVVVHSAYSVHVVFLTLQFLHGMMEMRVGDEFVNTFCPYEYDEEERQMGTVICGGFVRLFVVFFNKRFANIDTFGYKKFANIDTVTHKKFANIDILFPNTCILNDLFVPLHIF